MKILKNTAGCFVVVGLIAFCLWNRTNPNGFWWSGFICLMCMVSSASILATLEKTWIRLFRILSLIGLVMNGAVIVANGGRMPVMNTPGRVITGAWRAAGASDKLLWLCDRFNLGFATFSLGDFFLIGSLLLFVFLGNAARRKW